MLARHPNKAYSCALTVKALLAHLPAGFVARQEQKAAFAFIAQAAAGAPRRPITLELPTGTGKTAVGHSYLAVLDAAGANPLYYVVPTKALVDQVHQHHPDITPIYGRQEYPCLFFKKKNGKYHMAHEVPCLSVVGAGRCPHHVEQERGAVREPGAERCPYYDAKWRAKNARMVVCTASFFVLTQVLSHEFPRAEGVVFDEAHGIADAVQMALSYKITDWRLKQAIALLRRIKATTAAGQVQAFLDTMRRMLRRRSPAQPTILPDRALLALLAKLDDIDTTKLRRYVQDAVQAGEIDPVKHRQALRQLEVLSRDIPRYVRSIELAIPTPHRNALTYITYAYSPAPPPRPTRVQYELIVEAYYVAALIRRRLIAPCTLAYSATIGNHNIYSQVTGICGEFHSVDSTFSPAKTGVFLPTDTPDLAAQRRPSGEPARVLRRVANACAQLARDDLRSLVIVQSGRELEKFIDLAKKAGLDVTTYGDGAHRGARAALNAFRRGKGQVLGGTAAHFGKGIDLPRGICPVIWFLRPGYGNPADARSQFEERRLGDGRWNIWTWRAMIEALQARGRNVRSKADRGVTIFISQHFGRFLPSALPPWLRPAYREDLPLRRVLKEARRIIRGRP